ncbi:MAG: cation:proton antiporter [Firmicutes bacterium]|nr:cation:proton antiporter [Bacillota bacterium]
MDLLFKLALVILIGCLAGKLAKIFRLSNIFGYLLAGFLMGPSLLQLISPHDITSFAIVGEIALAIVAFKIGSEFVLKDMRKLGKSFLIITFAEVAGAVLVVFSVLYFLLQEDFVFSLLMAAISGATAPAASFMVMRQYRSDGPVTRTLLPVAAFDGVLGVVLFGVALSISRVYVLVGSNGYTYWQLVGQSLVEIIGSIALGTALGLLLTFLGKKAGDTDELLIITLALIFFSTSLAKLLGLSPLLTNIILGSVLVNLNQNSNRVFFSLNHFTPPVFLLFFTLIGASLDLKVVMNVLIVGVFYILARSCGKILGAWAGSKGVKADPAVQRYLGLALLPQGGISVTLAMLVHQHLPEYGMAVSTILVFSVLFFEVIGPIFAKMAIEKAGEVGGMGRQFVN